MIHTTRRRLLGSASTALPLAFVGRAQAAPTEVQICLLAPLSGPWAYNGELEKMGAQMAVEDVNRAGGIRALGGAMVRLRVADAGGTVEQARSAAQRIVSQDPGLVAGIGSWLSSFTLVVTEVTERARLPWVTLSWADTINERGFHYIISTSTPASKIIALSLETTITLAKETVGKAPTSVALISDNTASQAVILKTMRNGLLAKAGLKPVMDQVFAPPLSDASSLVLAVRRAHPGLVLLNTSSPSDAKLLLQTLNEFGLGHGRVPIFAPVATWGFPTLLKTVGASEMEGLIGAGSDWGQKREAALLPSMNRRSGLPWQPQETLQTYGNVMLIVDAMERAKSADRDKVMAALHATDTTTGPARYFLGDRLSFLPNGRRAQNEVALFQWQNGVPLTVAPASAAMATLKWPKPA